MNRWSGPLHQAALAVANGGLKICAAVLFNSNTVMFLQLCSSVRFFTGGYRRSWRRSADFVSISSWRDSST